MKKIDDELILNIADKISMQRYAFNQERAKNIIKYVNQKKNDDQLINKLFETLDNIFIDMDECGLEPTTTTLLSGKQIKDKYVEWIHDIKKELEL